MVRPTVMTPGRWSGAKQKNTSPTLSSSTNDRKYVDFGDNKASEEAVERWLTRSTVALQEKLQGGRHPSVDDGVSPRSPPSPPLLPSHPKAEGVLRLFTRDTHTDVAPPVTSPNSMASNDPLGNEGSQLPDEIVLKNKNLTAGSHTRARRLLRQRMRQQTNSISKSPSLLQAAAERGPTFSETSSASSSTSPQVHTPPYFDRCSQTLANRRRSKFAGTRAEKSLVLQTGVGEGSTPSQSSSGGRVQPVFLQEHMQQGDRPIERPEEAMVSPDACDDRSRCSFENSVISDEATHGPRSIDSLKIEAGSETSEPANDAIPRSILKGPAKSVARVTPTSSVQSAPSLSHANRLSSSSYSAYSSVSGDKKKNNSFFSGLARKPSPVVFDVPNGRTELHSSKPADENVCPPSVSGSETSTIDPQSLNQTARKKFASQYQDLANLTNMKAFIMQQQQQLEERERVAGESPNRTSSDQRQLPLSRPTRTNRVKLNIYDLIAEETILQLAWGCHFPIGQCFNALNSGLHELGTGAYHVGVEINGVEYAYGANETEGQTGVFTCIPRHSPGYQFRTTIDFGERELTATVIPLTSRSHRGDDFQYEFVDGRDVIRKMAAEYMGADYNLLRKNCCTFAHEACIRLGVDEREIPSWFRNLGDAGAGAQDVAAYTMQPLTMVFSSCDMDNFSEYVADAGFEVIAEGRTEQIVNTGNTASNAT